jgi:twitching motility two-component system response regulator PilH
MADAPQWKILVVEDDKFLSRLYSDQLRRDGFDVIVASSGDEGLGRARREHPDLVLLDIILPDKNGFDVLSALKLDEGTTRTPVVILTNLGRDADVQTGLKLGAAGYLIKTDISITRLGEEVRRHLVTARSAGGGER